MISEGFIQGFVDNLVLFATDLLIPFMMIVFVVAIVFRVLIYYTIKREEWFSKELDKRVDEAINAGHFSGDFSFFVMMKRMLERTFYELFVSRALKKRRRPDFVMAWGDRVFLIQQGVARLVMDTQKQVRFLKHKGEKPNFLTIAKHVFQRNPCFDKVFGAIPASVSNDVLNSLPSLFIIGGIFGTFLGIMKALPELGGMDLSDVEGTKATMDLFLLKISFSMSTSIVGIVLSVVMKIINSLFSPQKIFIETVERYEEILNMIWDLSESNEVPTNLHEFDEHKDPVVALAEMSVRKELEGIKDYNFQGLVNSEIQDDKAS